MQKYAHWSNYAYLLDYVTSEPICVCGICMHILLKILHLASLKVIVLLIAVFL